MNIIQDLNLMDNNIVLLPFQHKLNYFSFCSTFEKLFFYLCENLNKICCQNGKGTMVIHLVFFFLYWVCVYYK